MDGDKATDRIAAAAIRMDAGTIWTLPPPNRHPNVIWAICDDHRERGAPLHPQTGGHRQGFITENGKFVSREEAWLIAAAAGQLLERAPTGNRGTLFSEDLW